MRMVGGAAIKGLAVDLADERQTQAIAHFDNAVVALVGIATVLGEHAVDFGVSSSSVTSTTGLVSGNALEVHQLDGWQNFVFDVECQVGLAVEHFVDHGLIVGQVDLGLGRGAFGALLQRIGDGRVDRVGHHFAHRRTAIHLLDVREWHLAGTEALDIGLTLELFELGAEARIEVGGRNGDAQLALETVIEGFGNLHSVVSRIHCSQGPGPKFGAGERTRTSTPCGAGT